MKNSMGPQPGRVWVCVGGGGGWVQVLNAIYTKVLITVYTSQQNHTFHKQLLRMQIYFINDGQGSPLLVTHLSF